MPIEELCLGEVNDFTEIDRMLNEMDNPTDDAKTRQILRTIQMAIGNRDRILASARTRKGYLSKLAKVKLAQTTSKLEYSAIA